MENKTFTAWAIRCREPRNWLGDPDRIYFAGRYYVPEFKPLPPFEGSQIMLFRTRAEARKIAPKCRWSWDVDDHLTGRQYAHAVKVTVTISICEDPPSDAEC